MPLKAGVSRVAITPPIGTDLSGFGFGPRRAEGIHDDICAKALVLANDETKAAIICCDVLGIDADFGRLVKQEIQRRIGLPGENVMLCASHTHSAPAVHFLRGCGVPDPVYMRGLGAKLVALVKEAIGDLRPAQIGFGRAEHNLALNRRETKRLNTMDQEEGTVDREVGILRIDAAGRPLAVVFNYSTHPVTQMGINRQVTADYSGVASRLIESQCGGTALFLQGCCGNINPKIHGDFSITEKAGSELGEKVVAAWKGIAVAEADHLAMVSTELALPLDGPPPVAQAEAEAAKAQKALAADPGSLLWKYQLEWAADVLRHVREDTAPRTVGAPVQALRIGDGAIVAIPGEEFVETGRRIKDASLARQTLVAANSNSANMGYVPIREAYPKMGYEVWGSHMWYGLFRLAPGGAEAITGAALSLLQQLF